MQLLGGVREQNCGTLNKKQLQILNEAITTQKSVF